MAKNGLVGQSSGTAGMVRIPGHWAPMPAFRTGDDRSWESGHAVSEWSTEPAPYRSGGHSVFGYTVRDASQVAPRGQRRDSKSNRVASGKAKIR